MENYYNRWKDYTRESYLDLCVCAHGRFAIGSLHGLCTSPVGTLLYTARIEFQAPVQGGDPRGWAVYMGPNKTRLHGKHYFFSTREAAKSEVEFHYELDCAL